MLPNRIERSGLVVLGLLGLLPRLFVLTRDLEALILYIPDDAFYYLQIARNIIAGSGSTFDGVYPTNGYHPLWMCLLLPLATLTHNPIILTRLVIGVGILLSFCSALLLYALSRRVTGNIWLSFFALGIYWLNPQIIFSSVNVLETSVYTLLFVTLLSSTLVSRNKVVDYGQVVACGVILGLLFLARTDSIFYLSVFLLFATFQNGRRHFVPRAIILIAALSVVIIPWIMWNWYYFGSVMQSSGLAFPFMLHENFFRNGYSELEMIAWSAAYFLTFPLLRLDAFLGFPSILFQTSLVFSFLILWRKRRLLAAPLYRAVRLVSALWFAASLLIFVHIALRWTPREWYFDQLIVLTALTFILAAQAFLQSFQDNRKVERPSRLSFQRIETNRALSIIALIVGVSWFAVGQFTVWKMPPYPHQTEMLDAAYWLRDNLRPGETAVSFNSGIQGFFSGRRVVNLDGVINNAAYVAMTRHDLMRIVSDSSARYYIDYDPIMLEYYSPFWGSLQNTVLFVPIQDIDRPGGDWAGVFIKVYRLDWLD